MDIWRKNMIKLFFKYFETSLELFFTYISLPKLISWINIFYLHDIIPLIEAKVKLSDFISISLILLYALHISLKSSNFWFFVLLCVGQKWKKY